MTDITLGNKLISNQVIRFVFSAGIGFLVDISAFYLFYHNFLVQKTYHLVFFTLRNSTLSLAISFFMGVVVNFFNNPVFCIFRIKIFSVETVFQVCICSRNWFFCQSCRIKILYTGYAHVPACGTDHRSAKLVLRELFCA